MSKLVSTAAALAAAITTATATFVGVTSSGTTGSETTAGDDDPGPPPVALPDNQRAVPVFTCDGGRQIKSWNRTVSTYSYVDESGKYVPGARVRVNGPRKGKDTYQVTFSGDAGLSNSTDMDAVDYGAIQVRVDGSTMKPFASTFASPGRYHAHSAQFCARIGPGKHLIRAWFQARDYGADDPVYFQVANYTLRVVRSI